MAPSSGAVIFDGTDTKKYVGDLAQLLIVPAETPGGMMGYWVRLDGVAVSLCQKQDRESDVRLDSGSPLSALPTAIFKKPAAAFPSAEYIASSDVYSVDFTFAGKA
ncbi:Acid protease [Madurella mycetomatis]|uniref:Acid protease n=1 Tax=Madurella mycetomatis TaxID=100816 RepID=A0A175WGL1_9PEZI|nr:Acid protease [Madurella mycetomatis]